MWRSWLSVVRVLFWTPQPDRLTTIKSLTARYLECGSSPTQQLGACKTRIRELRYLEVHAMGKRKTRYIHEERASAYSRLQPNALPNHRTDPLKKSTFSRFRFHLLATPINRLISESASGSSESVNLHENPSSYPLRPPTAIRGTPKPFPSASRDGLHPMG